MGSGSGFSLKPPGRQRILASKNGISFVSHWPFVLVEMNQAGVRCSQVVSVRTLIMRTIKPIEQLVPVS